MDKELQNFPLSLIKNLNLKKSTKSKSTKLTHRTAKRSISTTSSQHQNEQVIHNAGIQGCHNKRVWKACERCRMKKTKCDGEIPCKRCKDDGLVCTAGLRKKVEYKQVPRGYAEVLENTQLTLIATIHKLYSMVRCGQAWEFGEPDQNECGLPIVHNIADKLCCIRLNGDIDLPVRSAFPEDEACMAELIVQLEKQQQVLIVEPVQDDRDTVNYGHHDHSSSSERENSDFELDCHQLAFGRHSSSNNCTTLSIQSYSSSNDLEFMPQFIQYDQGGMFTSPPSPSLSYLQTADDWAMSTIGPANSNKGVQFLQQANGFQNFDPLDQGSGLSEAHLGSIKSDLPTQASKDITMDLDDPMLFPTLQQRFYLEI